MPEPTFTKEDLLADLERLLPQQTSPLEGWHSSRDIRRLKGWSEWRTDQLLNEAFERGILAVKRVRRPARDGDLRWSVVYALKEIGKPKGTRH